MFIVFKESPKLKIVFSVETTFNRDIVLNELEELLFQLIDLFRHKEWIDKREVSIRKIPVIPNLLCNKERGQNKWPPVGGLQRHFGKRNESVDVN